MNTTESTAAHRDGASRWSPTSMVEAASWWWVLLVTGLLYIVFALVVLQFDKQSVTAVGIVVGILLVGLGLGDLLTAAATASWRWLYILLGLVFVVGGIAAMVYPGKTFLALATIIGFVLVIAGSLHIVGAFLSRGEDELWWLHLVSGGFLLLIGFWAGGGFHEARGMFLVLLWVGCAALVRGFTHIVLAFQLRSIHQDAVDQG